MFPDALGSQIRESPVRKGKRRPDLSGGPWADSGGAQLTALLLPGRGALEAVGRSPRGGRGDRPEPPSTLGWGQRLTHVLLLVLVKTLLPLGSGFGGD